MDRRSLGLAPTSPRHTMRALLMVTLLFATVPSAEALPSLPSISSSTGIAMAVVSVALALALVFGLAFFTLRNRIMGLFAFNNKKNPATKENVEIGQPVVEENVIIPHESREPPKRSPIFEINPESEEFDQEFAKFLQEWKKHSITEKEEFIDLMVREFPGAVTPGMAMDVLQEMLLRREVNVDVWMRMLRFILMLERDLYRWDTQDDGLQGAEFRSFLSEHAREILFDVGEVAIPSEKEWEGFMRFIAFLFGFAAKDTKIMQIMEAKWNRYAFAQTDASRAMVWGYARYMENPPGRDPSSYNYEVFCSLMEELRVTVPESDVAVGSKAQHLLFALGCGNEPHWRQGPLAAMCHGKEHELAELFQSKDYLWLMMGRHFVMGNAWQWMCKKELSEHNRMCNRFGQKGDVYDIIVDMVMKYDQEHSAEGEESMEILARNYSSGAKYKINFAEHRRWYDNYQKYQPFIGQRIYQWLLKKGYAKETEESKQRRAEEERERANRVNIGVFKADYLNRKNSQ